MTAKVKSEVVKLSENAAKIGDNITAKVVGNVLTLEIQLDAKEVASDTGKSFSIAKVANGWGEPVELPDGRHFKVVSRVYRGLTDAEKAKAKAKAWAAMTDDEKRAYFLTH